MDTSKLKTADWLMVGGGAAMLTLGFALPWTTLSGTTAEGELNRSGDSPFHYFFTGGIAWLLVVAVGALALLKTQDRLQADQPWDLIFVSMAGVATFLMVVRVLIGPGEGVEGLYELGRGTGMIGALIWSVITFAGALMAYRGSGRGFQDLSDMDKLHDRFGSDAPPPPSG